MKNENKLSLDFYIPSKKIAIECQGIQHFKVVDFSGENLERAENEFKAQQKRDEIKKQLCEEHGIKLLYYANYEYDFPYKVYTNTDELLKEIK